jgi:hypothetical protein
MDAHKFTAIVRRQGSSIAVPLPFDPNAIWGRKNRHHVAGTVSGFAVRGELRSKDSEWHLFLGPAWVRDHPLAEGQSVGVELTAEGPQFESVAEDVGAALAAEPRARAYFESLPTFYRKNYLHWIDAAKRNETRARRIAAMISLLLQRRRER